jgi:hypothetical protein
MSDMFDSMERDTILRALGDLRAAFSTASVARDKQRLADLSAEVDKRLAKIDDLTSTLRDLEASARLVQAVAPDLAFAFTIRGNEVRESIKKLNPADLQHKMVVVENSLAIARLLGVTLSTDYKELFENGV